MNTLAHCTQKRATDRIWTGDLILTKDALYQLSYCSLCLFRSVGRSTCRRPLNQSGRRGSNPPPIAWKAIALPNELLPLLCRFVGKSGLEPLNSEEDRFTVCCNCHYATSPLFYRWLGWSFISSSRWRDSNPRQADYKSATLPTELHRLFTILSNNSFFVFWGCKDTTFSKTEKLFFNFLLHLILISLILWWIIFWFFVTILAGKVVKLVFRAVKNDRFGVIFSVFWRNGGICRLRGWFCVGWFWFLVEEVWGFFILVLFWGGYVKWGLRR